MGLLNKFFKKNKEAGLLQLATETKKRIAKSVNYQFCFVALKGGYFLDTYQMDSLYNDVEAVKNFYLKALLFLKEKRGLKIPKVFLDLPIHFVSNEQYKGFVLEIPLARYECECNYVGMLQSDAGEKLYYTNELYLAEGGFGLCMSTPTSHISLQDRPQTLDEFISAIL